MYYTYKTTTVLRTHYSVGHVAEDILASWAWCLEVLFSCMEAAKSWYEVWETFCYHFQSSERAFISTLCCALHFCAIFLYAFLPLLSVNIQSMHHKGK